MISIERELWDHVKALGFQKPQNIPTHIELVVRYLRERYTWPMCFTILDCKEETLWIAPKSSVDDNILAQTGMSFRSECEDILSSYIEYGYRYNDTMEECVRRWRLMIRAMRKGYCISHYYGTNKDEILQHIDNTTRQELAKVLRRSTCHWKLTTPEGILYLNDRTYLWSNGAEHQNLHVFGVKHRWVLRTVHGGLVACGMGVNQNLPWPYKHVEMSTYSVIVQRHHSTSYTIFMKLEGNTCFTVQTWWIRRTAFRSPVELQMVDRGVVTVQRMFREFHFQSVELI